MTTQPNFVDFALGHYSLPIEVLLSKDGRTLGEFDTRTEADAFIAANGYVKLNERRANETLPLDTPYGHVPALEQDVLYVSVKHLDPEKNLTVNEKVQALLAKKGKPARSSSKARFTKALKQLVADWQAESLESCSNPKHASFQDTRVSTEALRPGGYSPALTFDGCGYDFLSSSADYPIGDYRNALEALCGLHGWSFEDYASWAITFYRN